LPRPSQLLIVAGTGTEVGKTWVAVELVRALLGRGLTVAARKPAQSFEPGAGPTDAELLAAATGEEASVVCPPHRWYDRPMAPPMAADALGRSAPTIDELVDELRWPDRVDVGLVETAGGVRSPLGIDGDTVALADRLAPNAVVVVAHAGLGTINDVRASVAALRRHPVVVVLNRFDPDDDLHHRNRAWLADRDRLDVVVDVGAMAARHPRWCRPKG
jgi:dethiobiotin synthetase